MNKKIYSEDSYLDHYDFLEQGNREARYRMTNRIQDEKKQEEKIKIKNAPRSQKAKFKGRVRALIAAGLVATSVSLGKNISEEIGEYMQINKYKDSHIVEQTPNEFKWDAQTRQEAMEYLIAARKYKEESSEEEKKKYENIIDEFVCSGKARKLSYETLNSKAIIAYRLGKGPKPEYDTFYDKEPVVKIFNEFEEGKGFRISELEGETYTTAVFWNVGHSIPKDLKNLVNDYIDYEDKTTEKWKEMKKSKRINIGVEMAEHIERAMNSYYVMKNNKFKEVNKEDYEKIVDENNSGLYHALANSKYGNAKELRNYIELEPEL